MFSTEGTRLGREQKGYPCVIFVLAVRELSQKTVLRFVLDHFRRRLTNFELRARPGNT
jgi:hypothetical protein